MNKLNIDFNYDTTKKYREKYEEQCDCGYCRNYYEVFKKKYPGVALFLEGFGLDVNFPLETMPLGYNMEERVFEYTAYYPVKGESPEKSIYFKLEDLHIELLKGSDLNNPCPNPKMEEPYILIEITDIKLPWVLDEDIE